MIGANKIDPAGGSPIPTTTSSSPPSLDLQSATVWLIGLGGSWVLLTLLAEFDDTRSIAVALAVTLLLSVLMLHGPQAFKNLGVLS